MMQEITLKQAHGRRIKTHYSSFLTPQMIIIFEDNTFTTIGIERGYEYGDECVVQDKLDLFDFGRDTLISFDIITEEEIKQKMDESRGNGNG